MDTKIYIPGLRQIITKSIFVVTLILYVFLKKANFFQIYSVYIENESLTETKKNPPYPCLIPGIYVIVIYGYVNVHR